MMHPATSEVLQVMGLGGVAGCEIGVGRGENAASGCWVRVAGSNILPKLLQVEGSDLIVCIMPVSTCSA